MFFIVLAVILVVLLAWSVRPPNRVVLTVDEVFDALSATRHYERLPQILQSLRPEDTGFLVGSGHPELAIRLHRERKQIALRYLNYLEDEYRLLLESSRILAKLSPELSTMDEFQRFRLNVRFILSCRYLRWRLRAGLQPWDIFGTLSDMEGDMTLQLEEITSRIGERAVIASEFPSFLQNRRGDS